MWAQIIKVRVKPGKAEDLRRVMEQVRAIEQPDSGLLRSTMMRDQKDPNTFYTMIVVVSEEKARARERDPRREGLSGLQAQLAPLLDGPPEFVDLDVLDEVAT